MQKLHLVGVTTERDGLILSVRRGARSGSYLLLIDDAVEEAVGDHRARQADTGGEADDSGAPRPPRVESTLPVREIQARLRQGRSVAEVAKAAGVDEAWVERFAPPVLAERAQVIRRVLDIPLERPRLGPSRVPIGEAVRLHLADRGVALTPEELADGWSAHQISEGRWTVRFTFHYRGKPRTLRYDLDEVSAEVSASDRTSGQLGYVAPDERATRRATNAPEARPAVRRPTSGSGYRQEVEGPRPRSRPAQERERGAAAMRKVATQHAAEAERAVARRVRERAKSGPSVPAPSPEVGPGSTAAPSREEQTDAAGVPAPARRAATSAASQPRKTPAKKAAVTRKAAPAKKGASARKAASAKTAASAKKAAPARKAAPAKKAPSTQKGTSAKKAASVKTAASARKAAPAKKAPSTQKGTSVKKGASAQKAPSAKKAVTANEPATPKQVSPANTAAPAGGPATARKPMTPVEKAAGPRPSSAATPTRPTPGATAATPASAPGPRFGAATRSVSRSVPPAGQATGRPAVPRAHATPDTSGASAPRFRFELVEPAERTEEPPVRPDGGAAAPAGGGTDPAAPANGAAPTRPSVDRPRRTRPLRAT